MAEYLFPWRPFYIIGGRGEGGESTPRVMKHQARFRFFLSATRKLEAGCGMIATNRLPQCACQLSGCAHVR